MKNHSIIGAKSTKKEKNSQDEGQEGQEGHQDGKKRARNENLRLRGDFEPRHFADVGPAGGVGGE